MILRTSANCDSVKRMRGLPDSYQKRSHLRRFLNGYSIGLQNCPKWPKKIALNPKCPLNFLPELDADDAGEGGSDEAAVEGRLGEAACEEVDVVHVLVGSTQPLDHGRRDLPAEVAKVVGPRQVADGPVWWSNWILHRK